MHDFTKFNREDFLADESFANYLLQKNATDVRFWKKWIKDNPACSDEIKEATLLFFCIKDQKYLAGKPEKQAGIEKQYAKLHALLKDNDFAEHDKIIYLPSNKKNKDKAVFRKILRRVSAAAAILLIAFSGWLYFKSINERYNKTFTPLAKTTNITREITLPDGSLVHLNNYSSLDIGKDYNSHNREVLLKGSAFFTVHKDQSKPFIVTSGSISTTALGTAFYVYSLHPESIFVSLLKGKVRVKGHKNFVELLPGEKAVYTAGNLIVKNSFDTSQLSDFVSGKIQFEHANLQEIKTILEESFNIEVLVYGAAPKLNFTGSFDTKKIETILEALQFTYTINYKLEGQKLKIFF